MTNHEHTAEGYPDLDVDELVGEADQTVATLRGEADELESTERMFGLVHTNISDTVEQLRHRADKIEEALGHDE